MLVEVFIALMRDTAGVFEAAPGDRGAGEAGSFERFEGTRANAIRSFPEFRAIWTLNLEVITQRARRDLHRHRRAPSSSRRACGA
ncbi:hypothetical protein AB0B50_12465 [Streptomyces sp. NPDC041068]|uniref:hypothetical protein n=1 Tax=Streptomyces sp. NPDC041068 TaxID=3155130 RepID=UPI003411648F